MALLRVFSLWLQEAKGGNKYLSGKWGDVKVLGFRNKSDNPKAPTYNIYFSVPDQGYERGAGTTEHDAPAPDNASQAPVDDDEAPF